MLNLLFLRVVYNTNLFYIFYFYDSKNKQSYFLIADACWLKESYIKGTLPSPIVRLFFDSWSDFKSSLKKVIHYHKNEPQTIIVPTHCAETTDPLIRSKIDLDVL